MYLSDHVSTEPRSWPHAPSIESQRKRMTEWILRRFSGAIVAAWFRQSFRNSRGLSYKPCPGSRMRRVLSLRSTIVSAYGINRVVTHPFHSVDIAAIFWGGRFRVDSPRTFQNPRNSSESAEHNKKIRGSAPFRGEKPCKTQVHGHQSVPETAPFRTKTAAMDRHWRSPTAVLFPQTESCASRSLTRRPESPTLTPLPRILPL
jgi:hypothetical protein